MALPDRADEPSCRAAIVAEARSWLETPYRQQADVKRRGVDCGMILVRIFVDLGLVSPFDPRPYPADFMLHNDREMYLEIVRACGGVEFAGPPKPGDVAVWRYGRVWSHGGIVTAWPRVIHAYSRAGRVLEDDARGNAWLASRHHPQRYFTLWPPGASFVYRAA